MKKNKKQKQISHGPISTILVMIGFVSLLSLILSKTGFQANEVNINNGALEASLVNIKNILSKDGIKYLLGNVITNFQNFKPLAILIISLIGIGICEKSGYLKALFTPLKKVKFNIIIFFTVLVGVIGSLIGDYSYLILIPFVGVLYKIIDRSPILGVLIIYLGITLGYGTNLFINYNDYVIGTGSQVIANSLVDSTYKYNTLSTIYIMVASVILMTYLITLAINKFLVPKFPRKQISEEEQELVISKKGICISLLLGFISLILVIYMITDINIFGSGILLDKSQTTYIAKLFSESSPFNEGIVMIISSIMMLCGFIYGKISKNIKTSHEYSLGLSKNFENLGFAFVLMFFVSQLIAIIDWTNTGVAIGAFLTELLSKLELSGLPLIIIYFIVIVLMSILIPNTITKWKIISPTIIPLFMEANITPAFTTFIFKIADSVGKSFSPFFIYFLICIAFLEKYRVNDKKQYSVFGILKTLLPVIAVIAFTWLLLICLWYLINIPIGINTYSTI